jgi:hypothetical protein
MFYDEYKQAAPTLDGELLVARFLALPCFLIALLIAILQYPKLQNVPGKLKWFVVAELLIFLLIGSPYIAQLLTSEGGTRFFQFLSSSSIYSIIGLFAPILFLFMLGFIPSLSHQPFARIKLYIGTMAIFTLLGTLIHFFNILENGKSHTDMLTTQLGLSFMVVTIGGLTLYGISRADEKRFPVSFLAVLGTFGVVWSPYIGSVTVFEACNAIHQEQLTPVIEGLQRYEQDSARYPLGVQALVPYYLEEKPTLLCFGNNAHYHVATCNGEMVLEMDDFYGAGSHRIVLGSDKWETSVIQYPACQPME